MKRAITVTISFLLLLALSPATLAAGIPEDPKIVDETFDPLTDDTMDSMGYLTFQATPPEGFSGNIRVTLRSRDTSTQKTVELTAWDEYYTGVWLPVGSYQVISGSVPDSDHFTVSWSPDEILISQDTDAALTITIASDSSIENEIAEKLEAFSPPPESEPAPAETTVEPTESSIDSQPETPAVFSAQRLLIDFLATAIFGGLVFLGSFIVRKRRENEE